MKGTNSQIASFTFQFEGDYVQVRGAKDNTKISRAANSTHDSLDLLPRYTCQVDGVPIKTFDYRENIHDTTNNRLCEQAHLTKNGHTLTMNITVKDSNTQVFWLDSIEYAPLNDANLTQQVIWVDSSDERSCSYHNEDGDWKDNLTGNATSLTGASMSFKFNGTSVAVYGLKLRGPKPFGLKETGGYYSIDSGDPIPSTVPGSEPFPSDPDDSTWFNQRLFNTSRVDGGKEHEMFIAYSGNQSGPKPPHPLVIDFFHVTSNFVEVNDTGPGVEPNARKRSRGKTSDGVIVGGVVGGVVALGAIAGLIWLTMKRRQTQRVSIGNGWT
ncbi:hypothetical protein PQX77_012783 [Marasmius sp. AFHP31]|nr:hypothetical protein PQX77_012783 [Marasmius sp. AFHP31]